MNHSRLVCTKHILTRRADDLRSCRKSETIGWRKAIPRELERIAVLKPLRQGIVHQAGLAGCRSAGIGTAQIRQLCRIPEMRVGARIGNSTGNDDPERSNRIRLMSTHARTQKTRYG